MIWLSVQCIDHIGIIVRNLDDSIQKYQNILGVTLDRVEDYGNGLLRIAFLPVGGVTIELIEPCRAGSTAWDYLNCHGEGIEHIAFRVRDLVSEWARLIAENIPHIDDKPRPGAGGTQICFLHRDALGGVLSEFVSYGSIKEGERS
jgi:methylmalonyl-CoA/ethylmalonyl-CoA epimerase